jgi:hypothetical protein
VYRAERLERFIREARADSALSHANIVPFYVIGEAEVCHFIAIGLSAGAHLPLDPHHATRHPVVDAFSAAARSSDIAALSVSESATRRPGADE